MHCGLWAKEFKGISHSPSNKEWEVVLKVKLLPNPKEVTASSPQSGL